MKNKYRKIASIFSLILTLSLFSSCDEGDDFNMPPGGYYSSSHSLTYSGWKLTKIMPDRLYTEGREGFTIQFYNQGFCMGKGKVNNFSSQHYSCDKSYSSLCIPVEYESHNPCSDRAEQRYFKYIKHARYYELIGDTILRIYPMATSKTTYLEFKNMYFFPEE